MRVGIKAIPYNHALRRARIAKGFTQKEVGEQLGLGQGAYGQIELMKSAVSEDRATEIALILDANEHELFPPPVRGRRMVRARTVDFAVEVASLDELPAGDLGLMIDGPDVLMEKQVLADAIQAALGGLSPREREVMEWRYGFEDGQTHTLEEIGQIYGVNRERIRIVVAKATRKLRHPLRSRKLLELRG